MSSKSPFVILPTLPAHHERPVKSAALVVFRLVREMSEHAKRVPDLVSTAADDIRSAWEESASPKP